MAAHSFLYCFLLLLLCFQCICISGKWAAEGFQQNPETLKRVKEQILPSSSSSGGKRVNLGGKLEDSLNQPGTVLPSTTPITNPANFPKYTPTPTIITVPASNPTSLSPTHLNPTPVTTIPTTPITNPAAPVTDPAATNPAAVAGTGGLANAPGQTWCVARTGAPESSLQSALDYACGIGGADCSMIQQGASCYNPNTIENHASYAFNSYFQKNPGPSSCDFGGTAVLVNNNPSTGTCVYPSSAAPTNVPALTIPPATPTGVPSSTIPPATTSSSGATGTPYGVPGSGGFESPPSVLGPNNPASGSPGIFGLDSPPTSSINSMPAGSVVAAASHTLADFMIMVAFFTTGKLILDA